MYTYFNMLWLIWIILQQSIPLRATLSCPDFKATNEKITIGILKGMAKEDVVECVAYFGNQPLTEEEGKYVWEALKEERGGVEEILDRDFRELGWIIQAIPVEDLYNITLNEVDTISALGQFHNLSEAQVLGERVLMDWANKGPEDYTFYDLTALQHIICGFNQTLIKLIHPDAYKEAAGTLAALQGCPSEAMRAIADLSQNEQAYGSTSSWSSTQLKNVGCVINGLLPEQISAIPPVAFEAITPDIIPCILPQTFKMVTSTQLGFLTPSVVSAITPQQQSQMSYQQQQSITNAFDVTNTPNSTFNFKPSHLIVILSIITLLLFESIPPTLRCS